MFACSVSTYEKINTICWPCHHHYPANMILKELRQHRRCCNATSSELSFTKHAHLIVWNMHTTWISGSEVSLRISEKHCYKSDCNPLQQSHHALNYHIWQPFWSGHPTDSSLCQRQITCTNCKSID